MYRMSSNLGISTSWNPQGLSRPVIGLLYLYLFIEYLQVYIITVTQEYLKCASSTKFTFIIPKVIRYKISYKNKQNTQISPTSRKWLENSVCGEQYMFTWDYPSFAMWRRPHWVSMQRSVPRVIFLGHLINQLPTDAAMYLRWKELHGCKNLKTHILVNLLIY